MSYNETQAKLLSFSEYTLEGFNDKKPLPKLNVDDIVYVRNGKREEWLMRRFSHFDKNGIIFCFNKQRTSKEEKNTTEWGYFSVENPLLETNNNKSE